MKGAKPRISNFVPDTYVTSLISAINDGAKTVQLGALSLSALAFYLFAVAISISDQDVLLAQTTAISQLGLQITPSTFFLVAPWVLLAAHVFTMIRFGMLKTNLDALKKELESHTKNREKYIQMLANIEFISINIDMSQKPRKYVHLFVWFVIVAVMPVLAIFVMQISALRYQSFPVQFFQRAALFFDLMLLIIYFYSNTEDRSGDVGNHVGFCWNLWRKLTPKLTRSLLLTAPCVIIFSLDLLWVENVTNNRSISIYYDPNCSADKFECNTSLDDYTNSKFLNRLCHAPMIGSFEEWTYKPRLRWTMIFRQPIDNLLCQKYRFGCRFLNIGQRMLIGQDLTDEVALTRTDSDAGDLPFAGILGINLNYHDLMYANFDGGEYYEADFDYATLTRSYFYNAHLDHATMRWSTAIEVNFSGASLQGVKMRYAKLYGADFTYANLSGADLTHAHLTGVHFYHTHLEDANFENADLSDADMTGWSYGYNPSTSGKLHPHSADLWRAHLEYANMLDANMQNVSLYKADFTGANLVGADLTGAYTGGAVFKCAIYGTDTNGVQTKLSSDVAQQMYELPQQRKRWEDNCSNAYGYWSHYPQMERLASGP